MVHPPLVFPSNHLRFMAYNILSLDGGGIYGALTIGLLDRIFDRHPDFLDRTDLIAGNSVGGVIALILASGETIKELRQRFPMQCERIFSTSLLRRVGGLLGLICKHNNDQLKEVFYELFGDLRLGELNKHVLVPAFVLNDHGNPPRWKAKLFHNLPGSDNDANVRVFDVICATTAAPIMLPSYGHWVDGTFVDNNPSLCAVCAVRDERNIIEPRPALEEIRVFSIGREETGQFIKKKNIQWGYIQWLLPLTDIILDRDSRVTDFQMARLINGGYCRLCPMIDMQNRIDDYTAIPALYDLSETVPLDKHFSWIGHNWYADFVLQR